MLAVTNIGCCVGPQNKIGHPVRRYEQLMRVPALRAYGMQIGSKTCVVVFLGLPFEIVDIVLTLSRHIDVLYEILSVLCCFGFFVKYLTVVVREREREGEREKTH